ncbi:MAG: TldD/PmbA family protein [Actinomycetota bacterium]
MPKVDQEFLDLPLDGLADAGLSTAASAGASHADLRVEKIRTSSIRTRDRSLDSSEDSRAIGCSVRVLVDGAWGFASTSVLSPDAMRATAERAAEVAKRFAAAAGDRVELADEPAHVATWCSSYEIDPFEVPEADRIAWLLELDGQALGAGADHVYSFVDSVKEQKFFASSSGSRIVQQRLRMQADVSATVTDPELQETETMETSAPPVGRGWEWTKGGWGFEQRAARLPELLREKLRAPSVEPGRYDLVLDPTHLWLTIHESVGHATEFDRTLGYEANYAGTSFATIDKLDSLRYGSPLMHITGDRLVEHGLSTVGFDDEGVEQQQWDIVRDGVLVGYQLDRQMAQRFGLGRSNGCAFADSPAHVPIQRMPNVSLQPGTEDVSLDDLIGDIEDGIYIEGDNSWSIDMQRYNFQFTGQRFYRIRGGRIDGMLRDVAYQSKTTDFWNALDGIGGPSTYMLGGAFNCGKGQPGQIAPVSHGAPVARFRDIAVLNTRQEAR